MKVLIVEQNRHVLNSLSSYLMSKGNDVNAVFDGVIAFNEFDEQTDLLIVDFDVPRISYLEVISLLKKRKPDMRVAVILGDKGLDEDLLVNNTCVDEYIPKPFTYKDIDDLLNNLSLDKNKGGIFLTYHEFILLEKMKKEGIFKHQDVGKSAHEKEEIYTYVNALNYKLENQKIVNEEKGFKLVESNV